MLRWKKKIKKRFGEKSYKKLIATRIVLYAITRTLMKIRKTEQELLKYSVLIESIVHLLERERSKISSVRSQQQNSEC